MDVLYERCCGLDVHKKTDGEKDQMPIIRATEAPKFEVGDNVVTGYGSPSRGAVETCVWRIRMKAGSSVPGHRLTREETFLALAGQVQGKLDGQPFSLAAGDALVVPVGVMLEVAVPESNSDFEAVCVMAAGGVATMENGETLAPPWVV